MDLKQNQGSKVVKFVNLNWPLVFTSPTTNNGMPKNVKKYLFIYLFNLGLPNSNPENNVKI
jgi:hypothetical protein